MTGESAARHAEEAAAAARRAAKEADAARKEIVDAGGPEEGPADGGAAPGRYESDETAPKDGAPLPPRPRAIDHGGGERPNHPGTTDD